MSNLNRRDIHLIKKIGYGYYGDVYKGQMKTTKRIIAVKKLKSGFSSKVVDNEIEIFRKLPAHKNIVRFIGTCRDTDSTLLIVTEFIRFGALSSYIQVYSDNIMRSKRAFKRLLDMCLGICEAMLFLESRYIIHRDLACRNVLVGMNEVVKVCDFGMARATSKNFYQGRNLYPVKWSAPEVQAYKRFSNKSDVWSFGCCMYEIFSFGRIPFGLHMDDLEAQRRVIAGYLPGSRPSYAPVKFYNSVFLKTWKKDPHSRPSFYELKSILKKFRY